MDDREFNLRTRELQLQIDTQQRAEQEVALRKNELRHARWSTAMTVVVALVIALITNLVVISLSVESLQQAADQFKRSSGAEEYNAIIQGLTSESPAVQINSVRRLSDFVGDRDKYDDAEKQQAAVRTAVQTLAAFVKDKTHSTASGLGSYNDPPPPSVGPALGTLRTLAGNPEFGQNAFDVAQADIHGATNLREFHPAGNVFMTGADLRRVNLTDVDFSEVTVTLRRAFLTCATLVNAELGPANLEFADLSGADLRGADLSHVQNLTARQLTGVQTDGGTRFPDGVLPGATAPWDGTQCAQVTVGMTGLRSGAGYDANTPCPRTESDLLAAPDELQEAAADDPEALLAACSAREP